MQIPEIWLVLHNCWKVLIELATLGVKFAVLECQKALLIVARSGCFCGEADQSVVGEPP